MLRASECAWKWHYKLPGIVLQAQQRSETQPRVWSGSSRPAAEKEESGGKLGEDKPCFQDVLKYRLASDEEETVYVYFSRIDEEEKSSREAGDTAEAVSVCQLEEKPGSVEG